MEEERNIITFFCFNGANGHGVGKSEMVYDASFSAQQYLTSVHVRPSSIGCHALTA